MNNAGVEVVAAYSAFTDEEFEAMVRLNLLAPMVLMRNALPAMLARGGGHGVTVSSMAGKGGVAYDAAYATTKAALVGLTRSLRVELAGQAVGASVVCPSFVAGDGMYGRAQELGLQAPLALRAVPRARRAGDARRDPPGPAGGAGYRLADAPLGVLQELAPRRFDRIILATGAQGHASTRRAPWPHRAGVAAPRAPRHRPLTHTGLSAGGRAARSFGHVRQ